MIVAAGRKKTAVIAEEETNLDRAEEETNPDPAGAEIDPGQGIVARVAEMTRIKRKAVVEVGEVTISDLALKVSMLRLLPWTTRKRRKRKWRFTMAKHAVSVACAQSRESASIARRVTILITARLAMKERKSALSIKNIGSLRRNLPQLRKLREDLLLHRHLQSLSHRHHCQQCPLDCHRFLVCQLVCQHFLVCLHLPTSQPLRQTQVRPKPCKK